MNRTILRRARKAHWCASCYYPENRTIRPGRPYLEHVYSPMHDDMDNTAWWRVRECERCAVNIGRGHLFPARTVTRDSDGATFEVLGLAPLEYELGCPDRVFLCRFDDRGGALSYVKVPVPSFFADFTARPAPPPRPTSVHVPATICQESP